MMQRQKMMTRVIFSAFCLAVPVAVGAFDFGAVDQDTARFERLENPEFECEDIFAVPGRLAGELKEYPVVAIQPYWEGRSLYETETVLIDYSYLQPGRHRQVERNDLLRSSGDFYVPDDAPDREARVLRDVALPAIDFAFEMEGCFSFLAVTPVSGTWTISFDTEDYTGQGAGTLPAETLLFSGLKSEFHRNWRGAEEPFSGRAWLNFAVFEQPVTITEKSGFKRTVDARMSFRFTQLLTPDGQ